MQRKRILLIAISLVCVCGVGYWFFKKPKLQSPSAFVQAQPDVVQLTYANNGQLLLASDSDGNVTFWDTTSKKQVGRLNDVVGGLNDAGRFVNTNKDRTLFLFSDLDKISRTGQKVHDYHLNFIHISAKEISSANFSQNVQLRKWTVSGALLDESPDLSRIVMLDSSHELRLIDTKTQKVLSHRSFENDRVKFTHDGKFLLSPDIEHPSYILNANDLSTYRKLPPLTNLSFSHDYQYIAGITWEDVFHSWNLKNQQHVIKKMSIKHTVGLVPVDAHAFSVYGRSGTDDDPVEATNIYAASGKLLEKIDSHSSYRRFRLFAYRAKNQKWMIDMYEPNSIDSYFDILNTKTGKIVHRLNTAIDIAGNGRSEVNYRSRSIRQAAFRDDQTQAAYSTADGMIRFYDFPPKEITAIAYQSNSPGKALYSEWPPGKDPISSYQILPDGKVSVSTGGIPAHQYEPPKSMERDGHIYSVRNIAFSPNGKALIFWSRDQTAEHKAGLKGASLRYDYLNHLFEVRNTNNNKTIQTLDSSGKIFSAFTQSLLSSFSIDGASWSKEENLVAAYIGEGCIGVWNTQTGRRIAFLSGTISPSQHDKPLYLGSPSIAISPDNNSIAATRTDGTIYLYSLKTCLPMAQLGTATKRVAMIQFSPDGHTLYGVTNGEVRSWNVPEIKP